MTPLQKLLLERGAGTDVMKAFYEEIAASRYVQILPNRARAYPDLDVISVKELRAFARLQGIAFKRGDNRASMVATVKAWIEEDERKRREAPGGGDDDDGEWDDEDGGVELRDEGEDGDDEYEDDGEDDESEDEGDEGVEAREGSAAPQRDSRAETTDRSVMTDRAVVTAKAPMRSWMSTPSTSTRTDDVIEEL
ncbi:hypothetical protein BZA05DRAFT_421619 [Tricharina praecox]|uniref:uncharacterized protein n=1 Tax=Tricharina praecox TaxID=43433 RepID=UPI002220B6D2|nr:uncharacterized protein BZA05DRAFT_421619 [Tricharina praecox]KAI5844685.1 hypothetical protein BZA05DRAFT_421619 [Tricharina praecox]